MTTKPAISTSALLLALLAPAATLPAFAQFSTNGPIRDEPTRQVPESASAHSDPTSWPIHTYFLKADDQRTMDDVTYALRSELTHGTNVNSVFSQRAIIIRLNPDDIPIVEKILADIDRPRRTYRVTYTLSEVDNNKRIGTQHFAVVMVSGQQTKFKQGTKVPIATGGGPVTQFTYVDVDLTVDATLQDVGAGGALRYNLDQTSVATEPSAAGPQNPLMRHTSLTGQASLTPGKPLMLGSIDFPGSTRRLDVEALMEPLP